MAKLIYKHSVVGGFKQDSAQKYCAESLKKGKFVLTLKPKSAENSTENKGVSYRLFETTESLQEIYDTISDKQKINAVVVDNAELCTKKQVDELREISKRVPVLCYGLKTNSQCVLFEGSKRLLEVSDEIKEIVTACKCGKKAIINGLFVKGLLADDTDNSKIENATTRPLCWSCYSREKFKSKIYDKLIKYLNIFENKETVGKWSSDTPLDNIILQKPFVIYDEEVENFINDFKEFQIKNPEQTIVINDNAKDLRKISMRGKSYDFVMTLISYVIKMENIHPGLLKTLFEDGTIVKWLKQIKKVVD